MAKPRARNRWWYVGIFLLPASVVVVLLAIFAISVRPTPAAPPVATVPAPHVKVVIDTSASMAGYFVGKTELKDFLANFIATAPQLASQTEYYFPGEAGKPFERFNGTPQTLIADVLNNQLPQGTNSMLQEVMERLRDQLGPGQLGVLVTDGIFSYSNEEVLRNQEINRNNLRGLAAQVQVVFDRQFWNGKKIDAAASVLHYSSAFNGTYYTYRNQRLACCQTARPFYVWSFGAEPAVAAFVAGIKKHERLKPQHEALFGVEGLEPRGRVLRYSNRSGRWVRNSENVLNVQKVAFPTGDAPLRVTLALDLASLPVDVLSPEYQKKNLKIEPGFATVESVRLIPRSEIQSRLDPNDADDLDGATHFIELQIKALRPGANTLVISLLDELPPWTRELDTNDDSFTNSAQGSQKTFGLLPILEGIANAFETGRPLFRLEFVLER